MPAESIYAGMEHSPTTLNCSSAVGFKTKGDGKPKQTPITSSVVQMSVNKYVEITKTCLSVLQAGRDLNSLIPR